MAAPKYRLFNGQRSYIYEQKARKLQGLPEETEDEWKERIREEWSVEALDACWVCLNFHDMDVDSDGNPKGLHAHCVAFRRNSIQEGVVGESGWRLLAKVSSEKNGEHCRNKIGSLLYLWHGNPEDRIKGKYIYDVSTVEVNVADGYNFDYRLTIAGRGNKDEEKDTKADVRSRIVKGLIEGTMTMGDVREIYATDKYEVGFDLADWQTHKAGYQTSVDEYLARMAEYYTDPEHARSLTNIYIQAPGEHRKTVIGNGIASTVADRRGIHQIAVEGKKTTFDFAGGYSGQVVTIANEISGSVFTPDQFCSLFDTRHAGIANSRFSDKPWFAEWCIFTASLGVEDFIWSCYEPWAKDMIHGQAPTTERMPDETDAEYRARVDLAWQCHYESVPGIADKIRQMRRRICVWLYDDGKRMHVRIRNPKSNPAHVYIRGREASGMEYSIIHGNQEMPWLEVTDLPNESMDDVPAIVAATFSATKRYYELAGYDVNPWSTVRPERLPIVREKPGDVDATEGGE